MPLTPDEYRGQVAALGAQMQGRFARIATDAAAPETILDESVRMRIGAAYQELRPLFAAVRALPAPSCLQSAQDSLVAAIDRYDEAAGYCLYGADLMDRSEPQQGLDTWKRGRTLEAEAHLLVRAAADKIRSARC